MKMEVGCSTPNPAEPCFLTQDYAAPENCSIQKLGSIQGKCATRTSRVQSNMEGGGYRGGTTDTIFAAILWISGFIQLLSLILTHHLSRELGLPHKQWAVKDTPQILFLGQWNQSKPRGLHTGAGQEAETHTASRDSWSHGAQQLLRGDSGDGSWRWPSRTETHTDACGKTIRSPFLSLATV